jgi:hypothetical protein
MLRMQAHLDVDSQSDQSRRKTTVRPVLPPSAPARRAAAVAKSSPIERCRTKSCTRRDRRGPLALWKAPGQARGPAHTGPDLEFLWNGRRDSNPRPSPWQGSRGSVPDLRRWTDLGCEQGVSFSRNRDGSRVSRAVTGPTGPPTQSWASSASTSHAVPDGHFVSHSSQWTSSTGSPAISAATQSTNLTPLTSSS